MMGEDRGRRIEDRGQRIEDRGLLAQSLATVVSPRGARGRRGITLLEVLISIGVVAGGLLSVAALLTLGSFTVNETAKADRSAALGRAAQHEVRVRGMLEPRNEHNFSRWCFARLGDQVLEPPGGTWIYNHPQLIGQPFAIDPLFATEAAAQGTEAIGLYEYFPLAPQGWTWGTDSRIFRLRLDIFEDTSLRMKWVAGAVNFDYSDLVLTDPLRPQISVRQLAVFDRIFRWRDDLIFDIDEDNPDNRPRQSCLWSDQSVAPYETPAVGGPNALHAQAADNYSWMLTAVPDPGELPNKPDPNDQLAALDALRQKTYEVSIVTFYKRDFTCDTTADPPSERFVEIQFIGTGIGGGDAVLTTLTGQAEEYLKVKENEWIMVTGFVREPRLDPIATFYGPPIDRRIAKWYRVIRVDDEILGINPGPFTRNITLAGPDWDDAVIANGTTVHATIIEGAIGVYTTTVTLE